VKSSESFHESHISQCLNYLKVSDNKLAILANFNKTSVEHKRIRNKIKNSESVVNNTQYKSAFKQIFEVISQASQELNVDSYVIGGFVRDLILNRDFKKDIDIVAVGSGLNWL
jgi:uncharacterized protein YPO0396